MKFEYIIKKKSAERKNPLETNPGVWVGKTVDWSGDAVTISLEPCDMVALQRKHGTKNVNTGRATQVKRLMVAGKKPAQIVRELMAMGHGYGERMIKADHAALSPLLKKARKKVQQHPLHL